jgi:hypothetical protein
MMLDRLCENDLKNRSSSVFTEVLLKPRILTTRSLTENFRCLTKCDEETLNCSLKPSFSMSLIVFKKSPSINSEVFSFFMGLT